MSEKSLSSPQKQNIEWFKNTWNESTDPSIGGIKNDIYGNISSCFRTKRKVQNHDPGYAIGLMDSMAKEHPIKFTRMFRLNPKAFDCLLAKIKAVIEPKEYLNHNNLKNKKFTCAKTRLAVTLRWLAGGSVHDICFAFGVSIGSFYHDKGILWGTMEAIEKVLVIEFPLQDRSHLESISEGFSHCCHGRMKGCVMAMDGWVCKTRKPFACKTRNVQSYRNRKNIWGVVCFAGCDHRCKFIMFSTISAGSTHDCIAWDISAVYLKVILEKKLPHQYYFISDEAIACTEYVLSPYGGRGIGIWKDSFNYHLSSMRQVIERAFGILVQRWGIFWRPLVCCLDRWALVIQVAARLHNLCIDENIVFDYGFYEDYGPNDMPSAVFMNDFNANSITSDSEMQSHNSSLKRIFITEQLQSLAYTRPEHAVQNSHAE